MLEISSVLKIYNNKNILSDIYLKCEVGDILAVFGRNGSGKSTLFEIIFGTRNAQNKFIKIDNIVCNKAYTMRNRINYLTQESFIPSHLSIKKVLSLYISENLIGEFCNDEVLLPFIDDKIKTLSGGELRYFELKLLLYQKSKFLLLDEPFTGMSPILKNIAKALIITHSPEKGIIISDHDYQSVIEIAHKNYLLKDGYLKEIEDLNALIHNGYLSAN